MKIAISLAYAVIILSGIILIPNAFAENVPDWVKNTAGWWAEDVISETEFVNAIAYLIKVGIISIESSKSPELIAEMWVNGDINDDEFLANVEQLIEKDIITIQSDSITKTSQLPDWLVNNAGWWAARIFTESDFTTFNTSYIYEQAIRCNGCIETINNHGFRGEEFSKEKSDNIFRIFAVGGSTTFGVGVNDNETWPVYLQQKFDQIELGVEVEIINFGMGNANTRSEVNLIKDKILFLNPDLIIMYDGWGDRDIPIDETIENWKSVCKLGKDNEFETIIAVQPIAGTGNRVLTEQELLNFYTYKDNGRLTNNSVDEVKKLSSYPERFDELNKHCYKTVNYMYIFDFISEPIYFDTGHTIPLGNKIIAENLYPLIKSLILENTAETFSKSGINHSLTISDSANNSRVFAAKANLSEKSFVDLDLSGATFFKANLRNANFNGANLEGVDFRSSDLTGASFNNANLNNAIFSFAKLDGIDISQESFSNVDLSKMDLRNADISNVDLSFINALRRIALSEIPSVAFRTEPHEDSSVNIITNTSSLHNEFIAHRIGMIPIHVKDINNFEESNYRFVVNIKNTTNGTIDVTTKDINVLKLDDATNEFKPIKKTTEETFFPPDPISKDYILIAHLKPDNTGEDEGEHLHFEATAVKSTGKENSRWTTVSQSTFKYKIDEQKAETALKLYLQTHQDKPEDLPPQEDTYNNESLNNEKIEYEFFSKRIKKSFLK